MSSVSRLACSTRAGRCLLPTLRPGASAPAALHDHQVAPVVDELIEQLAELQALHRLPRPSSSSAMFGIALRDGRGQLGDALIAGGAEQAMHLFDRQAFAAEGQQLIEQRLGVAHRAAGAAGDQLQGLVVGLHAFAGDDLLEPFHDSRRADAGEVEALAARQDRDRDLSALRWWRR